MIAQENLITKFLFPKVHIFFPNWQCCDQSGAAFLHREIYGTFLCIREQGIDFIVFSF